MPAECTRGRHFTMEREKVFIHTAELLISHGADVNSKEEDHRRTPLHRAVAAGQLGMVNYLLSNGADVNAVADFKPDPYDSRMYPDIGLTPLEDIHIVKVLE